jgi:hypothetical protein
LINTRLPEYEWSSESCTHPYLLADWFSNLSILWL